MPPDKEQTEVDELPTVTTTDSPDVDIAATLYVAPPTIALVGADEVKLKV